MAKFFLGAFQAAFLIQRHLAARIRIMNEIIEISQPAPSSCQERIMNGPIRAVHSDKELKFSCKHTRTGIRIINLYLDQFVISDYKKGKVENPSHTVVFLVKRKSLRNLPRV